MEENRYIVRDKEQIENDLQTYLKRHERKEMLRLLVAGSVDDGKSTLIGRLLYDSRLIYKDHLEAIYKDSKTFNTTEDEFDLSLLTDGLRAEREQGITIDVAYRYFSTEKRGYIICDAPGHQQYTRNMATGASNCDMALILVDAQNGIKDQTRRHSLIATLMGIRKIVVVINKMDLVDYSESVFESIRHEYLKFSSKLNIDSLHFIPISALKRDNVVKQGTNMDWYSGGSLLNYLETIPLVSNRNLFDFRFPVQYVIRPDSTFRGYAGMVVSGIVRQGDEIIALPSRKRSRVKSIVTFDGDLQEAFVPQPIVITLEDELDISRGAVLAKPGNVPHIGTSIQVMMVWMDESPLQAGCEYLLKSNAQTVPVTVKSIRYKYDVNKLSRNKTSDLSMNDVGRLELQLHRPLIFDTFEQNRSMGSFILIDRNTDQTSGGGIILSQKTDEGKKQKNKFIYKETSGVSETERHSMLGHKPLTIWLTGLSGSGKSTIAKMIEKILIGKKISTYILDGDNLRHGLCCDLGFSPEDRSENIRRVSEVAKMMNDAGLVVIAAFISPYRKDRGQAARIVGPCFNEVFVDAGIETCKQRDPKGLYLKAMAGEITNFTGIDSPYEKPENPDVYINTELLSVEESVAEILNALLPKIVDY
ncbi:MAG: sulfate adenylyltransferase subunit CysN [Prevotella sp.]|jgi:bifunctional enzyme CysN/CysC|nr:sulfate adenylyltransferase subunit CysN [Prevotella sp.]